MKVSKTAIDGVFIIEPQVFEDARGYFFESWNKAKLKEQGIDYDFIQDNQSKSCFGTIRGIHFQKGEFAQAKLVRVLEGTVLDVAVELSAENKKQLMIPRGFGHGFSVLTPSAVFAYKCDNVYCKAAEGGLLYNDPALGIDWKIDTDKAVLSEKDRHNPLLKEITCI